MLYRVLVEQTQVITFETALDVENKDDLEKKLDQKIADGMMLVRNVGEPVTTHKIRKITNVEQEDNKNVSPA